MGSSLIRSASALLALVAFAFATVPVADAAKREGSTYFMVGYDYHEGKTTTFDGGSSIDTANEGDFSFGFGYNFDKHLAMEFTMSFPTQDYSANLKFEDLPGGGALQDRTVSGEFDFSMLRLNGFYYFGDGPLSPYVSGGIGYTSFDSNIYAGSDTVCWWDPWYGYYCGTYQYTYGTDEWTYNAAVGVLLEMKGGWFGRLSYNTEWVDYDTATGTPSYDFIRLDFGMRY